MAHYVIKLIDSDNDERVGYLQEGDTPGPLDNARIFSTMRGANIVATRAERALRRELIYASVVRVGIAEVAPRTRRGPVVQRVRAAQAPPPPPQTQVYQSTNLA